MKWDICDYSTDGITRLTHYKRYITHLKNHLTVPNVTKGSETNFIDINIIRPPAKTNWSRFNALFVENVFRKGKILSSIMIISIKTLKGSLVNHVVESLGKKCTLSFYIEIKHPDPNIPFPEWSCEICKEP